jgi:hypothetical protein
MIIYSKKKKKIESKNKIKAENKSDIGEWFSIGPLSVKDV